MNLTFTGGSKLEAALKRIGKSLTNAASVDIGFMEGATYPDGTSVALVAAINEFGRTVTVKHPTEEVGGTYFQAPRPFFRNAIAKYSPGWPNNIAVALKANDYDAAKALDLVGADIASQVQTSIGDLVSPPLAPSTIEKKGFDKPLIEHGIMQNAVTHIVRKA